jgi:hypothetical protein
MRIEIFQMNGHPLEKMTKFLFGYKMLVNFWTALGEDATTLARKSAEVTPQGTVLLSFKSRRLVNDIASDEFDFFEKLPKELTADFDVKPRIFNCRMVRPVTEE